jgi:nicotinamide-nucleotide amidase
MRQTKDRSQEITELAAAIGHLAMAGGNSVAVAESLTCGRIAQTLGEVPDASTWFRGGVIAYHIEAKHRLLGVPWGPVVSAACAEQMARGALEAVGARISVAVTGVGGPGPAEGQPAGTVFIGVSSASVTRSRQHVFTGTPAEVLELTTLHALTDLRALLLDA